MREQVMLYEVKESAAPNAAVLFSDDAKYFYWNEEKFRNLALGDYVFVVNITDKWVLFTQLDKIDIPTTEGNGLTYFTDLNKNFTVSGQWNKFIRLRIIERIDTPANWRWTSFRSSETTYLHGPRISLDRKENRIKNIAQLKELTTNSEALNVLNTCLNNFTDGATTAPAVWFVTQGATFSKGPGKKFLWAPQKGKNERKWFYWTNVRKVKKGDIIFHYSEGLLQGVSIATSNAYEATNDDSKSPWERDGYKVDIDITLLNPPLKSDVFIKNIHDFNKYLKHVSNKPFTKKGTVNQGYLYEFSKEAGSYIRQLYNKPFGNPEIDTFFNNTQLTKDIPIHTPETYLPILAAIKTKPFVLLAGISGTGKSRLVRTLAFKSCHDEKLWDTRGKPGNFELIPVRPNWHDSTELLGYISRINGEKYITTTFLKFIAKAWLHADIPFFLCLDEMNLAPVEQYFAEYLSVIETRQVKEGKVVTDNIIAKASFENPELYTRLLSELGLENRPEFADGISLPPNLVVIGTVNMDETTHSFSRKVLDRAMTFEMNEVDLNLGLDAGPGDWEYPEAYIPLAEVASQFTSGAEVVAEFPEGHKDAVIKFLKELNAKLEGTPFKIAYRVRDEFLIYCYHASQRKPIKDKWLTSALDQMTYMKILPRIEGDESKTGKALNELTKVLKQHPESIKKLKEMQEKLQLFGYTSFWS